MMQSNQKITWNDFAKVDFRVGKIISAQPFAESKKAAYILDVDFGDDIGVLKSSAQITHYYDTQSLIGQIVVGIVNFEPKQIGPIKSECLITGFFDKQGETILCTADPKYRDHLALGSKLF